MLAEGDRLPEARVWLGPREQVALGEIVADGPALFFFYLFDWSSTWTDEMQLLRDRSEELQDAGVRPFGISRDSPWTHVAWMQALDLTVPLLSDWNADATRGFGLARSYRGMEDVPVRSAFLVDQGGTVRRAWRYDDAEVPDLDAIVAAAQAL